MNILYYVDYRNVESTDVPEEYLKEAYTNEWFDSAHLDKTDNWELEMLAKDCIKEWFYEHDGWEGWDAFKAVTLYMWTEEKEYLGKFGVEYEMEPLFYARKQ